MSTFGGTDSQFWVDFKLLVPWDVVISWFNQLWRCQWCHHKIGKITSNVQQEGCKRHWVRHFVFHIFSNPHMKVFSLFHIKHTPKQTLNILKHPKILTSPSWNFQNNIFPKTTKGSWNCFNFMSTKRNKFNCL